MEEQKLKEMISEYRDANSVQKLAEVLKDELAEALEDYPVDSESQEHDLNMIIRDLEEQVHWIESEKLDEFDPEQH